MDAVTLYLEELKRLFHTGHAIEQAYRPALQRLMESIDDTAPVNDPKHSEHGAPDFVFLKKSNTDIIKGYAEAKDLDKSLDRTEKSEQMQRYAGYQNLFLTDYLEFRFFKNGEKYETISLGALKNGQLYLTPENGQRLMNEMSAFMELTPESIKSGKRLAKIMGAKARRIRDNVAIYLSDASINASELEKIYEMMKKLLVHDLDPAKFADMYAQTLVYGLFVARYSDASLSTFSRSEARDLVPQSNPFLLHFFDHIAGTAFDKRLAKIVDELCDIFVVSDVQAIVHKHLRIADTTDDAKDPIIHFYEDFLQAYDPAERKRMGAYYTPIPVVKFIVRHIDKLLKEEFGIVQGLASTDTIQHTIAAQPWRKKGERKDRLTRDITVPRVQVLDPAVGTATFLNETIKFIHESFKGQEGRWPSYVRDNLLGRLYGFELMMAPYTIAHLKLGMTLKETGVDKLDERLNVYLTNTLEEGVPQQPDLFSFGLAKAVSEESRLAAEVKSEKPVMVVMGNPPYSVSSNNKSEWIERLMADYKKDVLTTTNTQPLSDDYLKFIKFAQNIITENQNGIVSYICNRSFIDGIVHHRVRESLMATFDKIVVVDLNGDNTRNQALQDHDDKNVFDIKQGTCIVTFVKNEAQKERGVFYSSIRGSRNHKFDTLLRSDLDFKQLHPEGINNYFIDIDLSDKDYFGYTSIGSLFNVHSSAIATSNDKDLVSERKVDKFKLPFYYRPFDKRYINYNLKLVKGNRYGRLTKYLMNDDLSVFYDNLILTCSKNTTTPIFSSVLMSDGLTERKYSDYSRGPHLFPAYLYHDGTRTSNFNDDELATLTKNLTTEYTPEDILDYIYATLHSPSYRKKYKEFLKIDFPRIPIIVSDVEFARLVPLGKRLRELHLMKASDIDSYDTTFPEAGEDTVEKIRYEDGRVYINATQYFGNVPELAWNFYIGGYQPAQKWLKDRKDRILTGEDLNHYQRTIKVLLETDKCTKTIG